MSDLTESQKQTVKDASDTLMIDWDGKPIEFDVKAVPKEVQDRAARKTYETVFKRFIEDKKRWENERHDLDN